MNFISLCSGIEAASVAFGPLGWKAIAFSEIDKFACAVLTHHYPAVRNYGDMSRFREWPEEVFAFADAVVGGPPCQAFSVAGARRGLADARGSLTLVYVELLDHADAIRKKYGKPPVVALYENVPGIFSDKTNAFGCLVGGLAGEDVQAIPPGKRWTDAGCVYGPERAVAWRCFDAQFFGLAQRRRRVFVVASARKGFDPAQVLFEWDGVRRDTAPSREARQFAPTIPARSLGGGGLGTDFDCDGGLIQAYGGNNQSGPIDVATARNACASASGRMDFETETFLVAPVATAIRTANTSANGHGISDELAHTLDGAQGQCVAFDTTQITSAANRSNPQPGDPCHPLAAGAHAPAIAFAIQAGALRTNPLSGPGGIGVQAGHAYTLEARAEVQAVAIAFHPTQDPISSTDGTTHCMGTGSSQGNATIAVAVQASQSGVRINDTVGTLDANYGSRRHNGVMQEMQVRRLTPTEAERLQGFPDCYTAIPWRGKPADQCPDGPRYKALGNSWAVPNVRWIGERIAAAVTQRCA